MPEVAGKANGLSYVQARLNNLDLAPLQGSRAVLLERRFWQGAQIGAPCEGPRS
jgi:hypothetical protein